MSGTLLHSVIHYESSELFKYLVQPVEQFLAHEAAIIEDAVCRCSFFSWCNHESVPGVFQTFDTDSRLPLHLLSLGLSDTHQDQGWNRHYGRFKGETIIRCHQAGEVIRIQSKTPSETLIGSLFER